MKHLVEWGPFFIQTNHARDNPGGGGSGLRVLPGARGAKPRADAGRVARVARAEANIRRNAGFVQAARLSGNSDARILATQVFPNSLPPMMVQASLNMGWAILNAAGLSFIGLGVRPPTPEWGIMVAEGANFIVSGEWWLAIFPGLALMLTVFTFNLMGDALRDIAEKDFDEDASDGLIEDVNIKPGAKLLM